MTEEERLFMAREWRDAAVARRDFTQEEIDAPAPERDHRAGGWWTARENIIDSMQDRINVIHALFPELRED